MINAGIIGASGYTGGKLMSLLLNHPEVNIAAGTSVGWEVCSSYSQAATP
jgi:N-acetyl-gamma-glutamylphosphate reductase